MTCNREKIVHVVLFITIEQCFVSLPTVDEHFMIVPGNKTRKWSSFYTCICSVFYLRFEFINSA